MKLLICTQAVDLDDPVLGFFHRWVVEFAKGCDAVHVICLKEGRHELPRNVFVHSLGKEKNPSRMAYIGKFYRYAWKFRREYDAVFVHMNPEYIVLGGALWRMLGKRVALWYVHWSVNVKLRIAVSLASVVLTASAGSFLLQTKKLRVLGHGIDTTAFAPPRVPPSRNSVLFLARLDPSKRADLFVHALEKLDEGNVPFVADIVGSPSNPSSAYAHNVRNLGATLALEGKVTVKPAVTHDEARVLFSEHAIFCNVSPSGMFDKTTLEAMASGCLVVTTNREFSAALPPECIPADDAIAISQALRFTIEVSDEERQRITTACRAWVEREHSLTLLAQKIEAILFQPAAL